MGLSETFQILQQILQDLASSPNGVSTGELSQRYNISRGAALKYIGILSEATVPIYEERQRYYLAEDYFVPFTLSPDESEFLYLALERSLIFHSGRSQTLHSLLRKLGQRMSIPLADYFTEKLDPDSAESPSDRWFHLLAQAKRQRFEVWVDYHPLRRPEPTRWRIRPFRFGSNPMSDGLYLFCEGTRNGQNYIPLSLRFDRILNVHLTDDRFDIAEMARFRSYDGNVWSVWGSDREPVHVLLRFEPRHYDRLLETIWHRTQQIHVDEAGYVLFSLEVSEPQEMVPWIRSWGSGVVVIEPEDLRQRIIRSVQRQLQAYGLHAQPAEAVIPLNYLWAKYARRTGEYHLLHYHLLDTAAVAYLMWEQVFSESQRNWIADLLNTDHETACRIMALFAGLHDIGKATPSFQQKAKPIYEQLVEVGVPDELGFDIPHGTLSAVILQEIFQHVGLHRRVAANVASVIGGHHGEWISANRIQRSYGAEGKQTWIDVQADIFDRLKAVIGISELTLPKNILQSNVFAAFLSGFVSVCDWIASNDTYFPYDSALVDDEIYFGRALDQAQTALNEMGWIGWRPPGNALPFSSIFPFAPNPMQQAGMQALDFDAQPRMILVEYLTGGGKTELALYASDILTNQFGLNGTYVAMPTRTTSNQMFGRVGDFLQGRYPDQPINMQLMHADADDHPLYSEMRIRPERDGDENGLVAATWFQNRKRSLLAPFAVGTIDQAMLSVLQCRHHFVRQYGLSHKVVIGDEIHNYDAYMYTIIERMLSWLNELQSTTILLSATLSRDTRARLIAQVGVHGDIPDVAYPRMTVVHHDGSVQVHPLPAPPTRTVYLHHIGSDIATLCDFLVGVYRQGGCIAIVCNTVDESIAIAAALRNHPDIDKNDVRLFHARYPSAWRGDIEKDVLVDFGKDGNRPKRAILVATQIIEQSLDLDFDLMVTSTAPIDLLIQRVGRLHRHEGRNRPAHLNVPTLVVRSPVGEDVPDFGVNAVIYARFVMLKTWLLLRERSNLLIPDEIDDMVNFVYNSETEFDGLSETYIASMQTAYDEMTMGDNGATFRGETLCIARPDDEMLIGNSSLDLPDDERLPISTRDIRPGIDIVCTGDGNLPNIPNRPPSQEEIRKLLQFRITVRSKRVKEALENVETNPNWKHIPQLRLARLIVFSGGSARIPGSRYLLRLTPDYGLEFLEEDA